jgi:probable F420-dependent oxidoreductase
MKHGLAIFATDEGIAPAGLARLAEERGFESLFFTDHTHIPAARTSPAPRGGELPREYSRILDPFVALTAAALATTELRVGTGICLVVERDPIATAKAVATLDFLSDGRFLFGVGAGWNLEEMENHGTDPSRRFALMRERVLAMKAVWTEEEASFSGEFVNFDRIWSWPKPVQDPHPPVLIGGNGPRAIQRVLAYGDEWLPEPEEGLAQRMHELQEAAQSAGRRAIPVTVYGAKPEEVETYTAAGAHRCVYWLPPRDAERTVERVNELAAHLGLDQPDAR